MCLYFDVVLQTVYFYMLIRSHIDHMVMCLLEFTMQVQHITW